MTVGTSAKAIIVEDGRLLTLRKERAGRSYYVLPGGSQRHGETLSEAVAREVREEVGARIEVGRLLHVRDYVARRHEFADQTPGLHRIELFFACRLLEPADLSGGPAPDRRQVGVEWMPLDALAEAPFYPQALIPILQGEWPDAPVYLGDVN
jgi:ADP-ribose pyrophosphatase YjhB (NUDIX family)